MRIAGARLSAWSTPVRPAADRQGRPPAAAAGRRRQGGRFAATSSRCPAVRRVRRRRRCSATTTSTPWSRSSVTSAWAPSGRCRFGIHPAAGPRRGQVGADRGDRDDHDQRQKHPAPVRQRGTAVGVTAMTRSSQRVPTTRCRRGDAAIGRAGEPPGPDLVVEVGDRCGTLTRCRVVRRR